MSCARMRGKSARAMAFAGALALAVALWVAPGQALAEEAPESAIGVGVSTSVPDEYGVIALLAESGIPMTADALVVDVEQEYGQAYEVLDLVNAERAKEGLSPLAMDRGLLEAAMQRAVEISYYFSHERPDGTSLLETYRSAERSWRPPRRRSTEPSRGQPRRRTRSRCR